MTNMKWNIRRNSFLQTHRGVIILLSHYSFPFHLIINQTSIYVNNFYYIFLCIVFTHFKFTSSHYILYFFLLTLKAISFKFNYCFVIIRINLSIEIHVHYYKQFPTSWDTWKFTISCMYREWKLKAEFSIFKKTYRVIHDHVPCMLHYISISLN